MGNTENMDFESCNFETKFKISVWVSEKNITLLLERLGFWFMLQKKQELFSEKTFPGCNLLF